MVVSPIDTRYKTKMNEIFEEENKINKWMLVEATLSEVQEELGIVPKGTAADIKQAMQKVELSRVKQIEANIHHDLMAMVKALTEQCEKYGGYVHFGSTSYDIEDTATALILGQALDKIIENTIELSNILKQQADKTKELVCVGRTHGQHAVPTTYGMKFAIYYTEIKRSIERLKHAKQNILVGKMAGATGTMATFGEHAFEIQQRVMEKLGLRPAPISNQVIQRDRHAEVILSLAILASSLDKIAKEIRNLQRTEILEIAEPYVKKSQVGSSTMPHKRNPHKSERICSLARLIRANSLVALENIGLEHERDLTNSANERFIFSQSFILLDYMLEQMKYILENLEFFEENIERNLNMTKSLILAERIMVYLSKKGIMGRQQAHEFVRQMSIKAKQQNIDLKQALLQSDIINKIDKQEFEALFDPHSYIGKAKEIVERVINE